MESCGAGVPSSCVRRFNYRRNWVWGTYWPRRGFGVRRASTAFACTGDKRCYPADCFAADAGRVEKPKAVLARRSPKTAGTPQMQCEVRRLATKKDVSAKVPSPCIRRFNYWRNWVGGTYWPRSGFGVRRASTAFACTGDKRCYPADCFAADAGRVEKPKAVLARRSPKTAGTPQMQCEVRRLATKKDVSGKVPCYWI